MSKTKKMFSILIIIIYLILLIPYVIVSNVGETGIIIKNEKIDLNSLPNDIQDLLIYKKSSLNLILIEDQISKEKIQSQLEMNPIIKEKKLVISEGTQREGSFVKVDNITTDMYIMYNDIPELGQSYEKLIIGDVNKAIFGEIIEFIFNYNLIFILSLSKIAFLVGGLLVVVILSFLICRTIALWNTLAIITCYSFQFFLSNLVAGMNMLKIDTIILLFGFMFMLTLPLTFWIKRYEETENGKEKIHSLYLYNKNIALKIKNKLGI